MGTCGDGQDLGRRGVGLSARSASQAREGLWTRNEPGGRGAGEAVRGCGRDPEGSSRGAVERGWGAECSPDLRVTKADVSAGPAALFRWEPSRASQRSRVGGDGLQLDWGEARAMEKGSGGRCCFQAGHIAWVLMLMRTAHLQGPGLQAGNPEGPAPPCRVWGLCPGPHMCTPGSQTPSQSGWSLSHGA